MFFFLEDFSSRKATYYIYMSRFRQLFLADDMFFFCLFFSSHDIFLCLFFFLTILQVSGSEMTSVVFEMSKDEVSELQRQVAEIQSVISSAI